MIELIVAGQGNNKWLGSGWVWLGWVEQDVVCDVCDINSRNSILLHFSASIFYFYFPVFSLYSSSSSSLSFLFFPSLSSSSLSFLILIPHSFFFSHFIFSSHSLTFFSSSCQHVCHVIDFGLAKRYQDPRNGRHIPYIEVRMYACIYTQAHTCIHSYSVCCYRYMHTNAHICIHIPYVKASTYRHIHSYPI